MKQPVNFVDARNNSEYDHILSRHEIGTFDVSEPFLFLHLECVGPTTTNLINMIDPKLPPKNLVS